jgi:exosortase
LLAAARELAPLVLLLLLAVLAYQELVDFRGLAPGAGHPQGLEGQLFVPNQKSPVLIYGITAWFLLARLPLLGRSLGSPTWTPTALPCLAAAALLGVWAHLTTALPLLILSLCLMILGAGALLGGHRGMRLVRLPALFLLLALPIPPVLLNQMMQPLQLYTAWATGVILDGVGITNIVHAEMVQTGTHTFEVIESCSGLRSIETLVMSAVLYQEILPHTRLRSWLLVLSAPLLGILVNQARVLSIVLNPLSHFAAVHTLQGIVMIVLGVLLLAALDWLLRQILPGPTRAPARPSQTSGAVRGSPDWPLPRVALLASLLLAMGAIVLQADPFPIERPLHVSPYELPGRFAGWTAKSLKVDDQYLGSTSFTQRIDREYRRGDDQVFVFVGVDRRVDPRRSGLSPKIDRPGPGWEILESQLVQPADAPFELRRSVVRGPDGRALLYSWSQGNASLPVELLRGVFGLERSPFQRPYSATSVRIHTPLREGEAGQDAAEARLEEFLAEIRTRFPAPAAVGE